MNGYMKVELLTILLTLDSILNTLDVQYHSDEQTFQNWLVRKFRAGTSKKFQNKLKRKKPPKLFTGGLEHNSIIDFYHDNFQIKKFKHIYSLHFLHLAYEYFLNKPNPSNGRYLVNDFPKLNPVNFQLDQVSIFETHQNFSKVLRHKKSRSLTGQI